MIQHLIVLPVVLPLVAGIVLLYQRQGLAHYKRAVSVIATMLLLLVSIAWCAKPPAVRSPITP